MHQQIRIFLGTAAIILSATAAGLLLGGCTQAQLDTANTNIQAGATTAGAVLTTAQKAACAAVPASLQAAAIAEAAGNADDAMNARKAAAAAQAACSPPAGIAAP